MPIGPAPERDETEGLLRRLRRLRTQARAVLLFERAWPAFWPAFGVIGVFLCAALLDLLPLLPGWPHALVLALFAAALGYAIWRGIRQTGRTPGDEEADRRLERATGLLHRPLATITDAPALPGADALWRAHVARAVAQVSRLRVGLPKPGLAARDPRALRAGLIVGLVACLVVAGPESEMRLWRAITPGFAPPAPVPPSQLQAWITPPSYTGLAPLFLKADSHDVSVPAGSHLSVNVTGGSLGQPTLTLAGQPRPFKALDTTSFQADQDLSAGGRLEVRKSGRSLGAWDLTVIDDTAPVVSWPEPPGRARGDGRVPATRLPWEVSHRYGVNSLVAELRLDARPNAPPVVVQIPLPGGAPKAAHGVRVQDLTANPWAGLPVTGRLVAKDAPGLTGTSADAQFTLPERRFDNPIAKALMEVRKNLSVDPDNRAAAIVALATIADIPDAWAQDFGAYLNLQSIIGQLHFDAADSAVPAVQERMWLLALHLEEGATERTARELAEARQKLQDLLDQQQRGDKVDQAQLDKAMRDVQQALQQHLQALAEQMRRDPDSQNVDPQTLQLDSQDMQKLAEDARKALQENRPDDARQKLAELDKELQELQNGRPEHGQMTERERQRMQQRQRGQQQMNALQDMVQREGSLLDRSEQRDGADDPNKQAMQDFSRRPFTYQPPRFDQFGRLLPPEPPPQQQAPTPSPAEQQQQAQDRSGDQKVQQALRRALGELMQQYADLTGKLPPNLGDADTAMHDAIQSLDQGKDAGAADGERRAIEALQKGGRSMSEQMAQQFGRSQGEGQGDDQGDDGDQAGDQDGNGDQMGQQDGNGRYGGQQYGQDRGWGRQWGPPNGRADRRADDRRDPLGRPLTEGTSGSDESGDVKVPEKMEQARTREIQDELRRRDADRTRPQEELDYIDRLLKQF